MSFFKRGLNAVKSAVAPSNPVEADADRIARVAVDAMTGNVNVGPLDALLLKGAFERYKSNPDIQTKALERFAELLTQRDLTIAHKLTDFLVARVGK
jgi:hypothetical protein